MNQIRWLLLVVVLPLCGCNAWNNLRGESAEATPKQPNAGSSFWVPGFGTNKFGVNPRAQEIEESLGVK